MGVGEKVGIFEGTKVGIGVEGSVGVDGSVLVGVDATGVPVGRLSVVLLSLQPLVAKVKKDSTRNNKETILTLLTPDTTQRLALSRFNSSSKCRSHILLTMTSVAGRLLLRASANPTRELDCKTPRLPSGEGRSGACGVGLQ